MDREGIEEDETKVMVRQRGLSTRRKLNGALSGIDVILTCCSGTYPESPERLRSTRPSVTILRVMSR